MLPPMLVASEVQDSGHGAQSSCHNALLCLFVTDLGAEASDCAQARSSPNCCCQVCPTLLCEWFHGQPTGVYSSVTAPCQYGLSR